MEDDAAELQEVPPDPFAPAPGPLPPVIPGDTPEAGAGEKKRRVQLVRPDGTPTTAASFDWKEYHKTGDVVMGGTDFAPSAPRVGHKGKGKADVVEYRALDREDQIPDTVLDSELRAIPFTFAGSNPPLVLFVEIWPVDALPFASVAQAEPRSWWRRQLDAIVGS